MIIKQTILDQINNTSNRINICQKLGIGEQALIVHIKDNKDNGRLTKLESLKAIAEETGLPIDELTEEIGQSVSTVGDDIALK